MSSLSLPQDLWDMVDDERDDVSKSAYIRDALTRMLLIRRSPALYQLYCANVSIAAPRPRPNFQEKAFVGPDALDRALEERDRLWREATF